MTKNKIVNLLAFAVLITLSTGVSGIIGYWLCFFLYLAPYNVFSFAIPQWLLWATGIIFPILSFAQTLLLFKVFLLIRGLKATHIKDMLLPFTITFVPSWLLLSPWAMMWALLCKWHRISPSTAEATYLCVLQAVLEGMTLLGPMFIIASCLALYSTCIWHAFKNVFGDCLSNTGKPNSIIHQ